VDRRSSPPLVVVRARVPAPRSKLVRRERLLERLNDAADRRITLIQAPAGYGKSSVLAQWAQSDLLRRFGWLTLEATDNDPVLFLRDILFALRALVPGFADMAWGLLHGPQPDLDALVTHVLNASLDVPGRIVLILDDYHVIANPRCHDLMQNFIDHLPSSMQVAFGTRTRPPLSLSKFEASGFGLTIDTKALQFTPEETKEEFHKAGHRLGR
jgi:LuxR family maltose regulon positive regulatory protein